jgi:hypothetical protein
MNPSNPTVPEMQFVERLFIAKMQQLTREAVNPQAARLRSFDFQCSDQWM